MFKVGDEVERIAFGDVPFARNWGCDPEAQRIGARATVIAVVEPMPGVFGLFFKEFSTVAPSGFAAESWRKVQRRDIGEWLKTSVGNTSKWDKTRKVSA